MTLLTNFLEVKKTRSFGVMTARITVMRRLVLNQLLQCECNLHYIHRNLHSTKLSVMWICLISCSLLKERSATSNKYPTIIVCSNFNWLKVSFTLPTLLLKRASLRETRSKTTTSMRLDLLTRRCLPMMRMRMTTPSSRNVFIINYICF